MATKDEYIQILYTLLPQGPAWSQTEQNSLASDALNATATQLAAADAMIEQMLDELIPSTTVWKLETWLEEWGLPDECMTALGQYDFPQDKLQQALSAKVASWGLGLKDALKAIAQRFGYSADIERYKPFLTTSKVNDRMYDYTWANTALIITTDNTNQTQYFLTNWTADQPLARWGDRVYECMVRQIIPAHLVTIFSYPTDI